MSARDHIRPVLDRVMAAQDHLPFHEDLEQGTQERRDWIKVREHLSRARAMLFTMQSRQGGGQ